MLSHRSPQNGLEAPFTSTTFVVRNADLPLERRSAFGSTVDRPSTPKITAKCGKNFISVTAVVRGGLGVPIAPYRKPRIIMSNWGRETRTSVARILIAWARDPTYTDRLGGVTRLLLRGVLGLNIMN